MEYNRNKGQVPSGQVYAVILVGGKGKRLRPLSSDLRPKAFLPVTKDRKTMFGKTLGRARRLVPGKNVLIVANKDHAGLVKRDFSRARKANLLLEPVSRNTAPAITLAAFVLSKRDSGALMVILPTDQYIVSEEEYLNSIKRGVDFVKNNSEAFVVIGVRPIFPSTEFGYMKTGDRRPETGDQKIYKVEKFTEKPDRKTAVEYVREKRYLWNTGAFIFKASAFLRAVKKLAPDIYDRLKDPGAIVRNYAGLPDISIDYAIMEKMRNIYCVTGEYGWHDMGSFDSLAKVLRREKRDFITKDGRIVKIL